MYFINIILFLHIFIWIVHNYDWGGVSNNKMTYTIIYI